MAPERHVRIDRLPVVLNVGGGTVARAGAERIAADVAAAFEQHGIRAEIMATKGPALAGAVRKAVADGAKAVAVGGGDGSISAAAAELAGGPATLAVLPLGTLNHFARDLGLADLDSAAAAVVGGHVRAVDLAEVNGRPFVNNSSIGLYPQLVLDRARGQQALGVGKWPAMLIAALRTLRRFPRHRLLVQVAGQARPVTTPCLFVGNNDYELAGLQLGRRERLDDGALFVGIVRGTSLWSLARLTVRAALGRVEQDRDLVLLRGLDRLGIDSRARRLTVSVDGEVVRLAPPLEYRIRPRALRLFAPKEP